MAWWTRSHVQQSEEECCDGWVLWAFPDKATVYAKSLVETVEYLAEAQVTRPAVATAFNASHSLRRRIEMIVLSDDNVEIGIYTVRLVDV